MKKILVVAFFLFIVAAVGTFAQTDATKVIEASNDFAEIKVAFQRRVHNASSEFKYFLHDESPFDVEKGAEGELFDKKGKRTIENKRYFIFDISSESVYFLFLVNKEDAIAISFFFINDWLAEATQCSDDEIDKALASYLDL
jgi:hypothetical protein